MFCVICENYILTEEEAAELENKKKQETVKAEQKVEAQMTEKLTEQQETKPVHSPIQTIYEERKRQKIERETTPTTTATTTATLSPEIFASSIIVSTLSSKMNELSDRVKSCHDPKELVNLFKAIKECADAIKACVEAGEVYDKMGL